MIKEFLYALKKILYVYSKEYRQETKMIEFQRKMLPYIKLKGGEGMENIDEKLDKLIEYGYQNNCKIQLSDYTLGSYSENLEKDLSLKSN